MKRRFLFIVPVAFILIVSCKNVVDEKQTVQDQCPEWVIVIHGGAGYINQETFSAEKESQHKERMEAALLMGGEILKNGGSSLDAVEAAIRIMEDSPFFNAGRGAVFNADGINEMDASIMDGKTGKAGAVANVTVIKNPISAARKVMEQTKHVMLIKQGAEKFASEQGLDIVDPSYFFTQESWDEHINGLEKEDYGHKGTVGCVHLNKNGNLAASTPLALLVEQIGWRYSFVISGVATAVLAILFWTAVRDRPESHLRSHPDSHTQLNLAEGMKLLLLNKNYWLISCGTFFRYGALMAIQGLWAGPYLICLLYTSPSPRDRTRSRMPSSA